MKEIKTIVNLTGKPVQMINLNGDLTILPPSKNQAQLTITRSPNTKYSSSEIEINTTYMTDPVGIPKPMDGVVYIVSQIVYNSLSRKRDDLFVLDKPFKHAGKIMNFKAISQTRYKDVDTSVNKLKTMITQLESKDEEQADKILEILSFIEKELI